MRIDTPFATADEALQAVIKLPPIETAIAPPPSQPREESTQPFYRDPSFWTRLFLVLLFLGSGVILLRVLVGFIVNSTVTAPPSESPVNSDALVIPQDTSISYLVEPEGSWEFALDHMFSSFYRTNRSESRRNVMQVLEAVRRFNGLSLNQRPSVNSIDEFQARLRQGEAPGLMRIPVGLQDTEQNTGQDTEFDYATVAYDGIVIMVPFSDIHHTSHSAVAALNGRISWNAIRQIFTSSEDPDPTIGRQTFRPYFPDDLATVRLFEELVLSNTNLEEAEQDDLIAQFQDLRIYAQQRDSDLLARYRQLNPEQSHDVPSDNIYKKMLFDHEYYGMNGTDEIDQAIAIGFDRLSNVFGQCSVYPLAIRKGIQVVPVLVGSDRQPIDETVDLCGAKGSYFPNPNFSNYPLSYALGVVYPATSDESASGPLLADILSTIEGQYMLSEAGLVPAYYSIPEIWEEVWNHDNE